MTDKHPAQALLDQLTHEQDARQENNVRVLEHVRGIPATEAGPEANADPANPNVQPAPACGAILSPSEIKTLYEWMREPDWVETASLDWLVDWMNRRPLGIISRAQHRAQTAGEG